MNRGSLLQSWRRFNFFDRERVKDPENEENAFVGFQDLNILTCVYGNGTVFIGETDGGVHQIVNNRTWETNYFRAYKNLMYQLVFIRQKNILVTVGEDGPGINPFLKVWNLDKIDKHGNPFCTRCSKVSPGNRAVKATCLAVHASLQLMAVGFEDSSVLLYRGDVTKEKQSKMTVLRDGLICAEDGAITALAFHSLGDKINAILYMGTVHVIATYSVSSKEKTFKQINLYKETCSPKCWALADQELQHQFIVGRREGVYFYQNDGKGGVQLFEGEKVLVKSVGNYLLIVYRDVNTLELDQKEKMNLLTIYDITNVYIAYSAPIPQVADVFYEYGSFYVITKSGHMFELIEKDTQTKLEILFRKNLYDLAVKLAESFSLPEEALAKIYTQYGDFLYAKNDYSNAVKQYIKTIGRVEPSYIIKKFLDSQRIEQMTEYLEALHKTQFVNYDHTMILLNCYTKLSDSAKIDKFIKASDQEDDYFDVETGISVLRESGYLDHAILLAKRYHKFDAYLRMLIEDKRDYQEAITTISSMQFDDILINIKNYGKILITEVFEPTMKLIKELCIGFKNKSDNSVHTANPVEFIHIFVQNSQELLNFLEFIITEKTDQQIDPVIYHTLLELYLKQYANEPNEEVKTKILNLLKYNFNRFELDQALILCQTHNFDPGLLYLYEKSNLTKEILELHIKHRDFQGVLAACQKSGDKEMWIEALWFFARSENAPEQLLEQLLSHIDEKCILPPLMVLEILSRSPTVTLGMIKDYLLKWLKYENDGLQKYEREITYFRQEIDKNQSIIDDIEKNPQIFQISKCSACDTPLEAPTVHFLCKHSYHQHCFESYSETDNECPACLPENKKLRASLLADDQMREIYQQFRSDLLNSNDTISTIAEYFGKGAFHEKSSPERQKLSSTTVTQKSSATVSQKSLATVSQKQTGGSTAAKSTRSDSTVSSKPLVKPTELKNPFESTNPFDEDEN